VDLSLGKLAVQPEEGICLRRRVCHRLLGVVHELLGEVPMAVLCKYFANSHDFSSFLMIIFFFLKHLLSFLEDVWVYFCLFKK